MSLAEMMILRSLTETRKEPLSEIANIIQMSTDEARKNCNNLIKLGLIELVRKDYMLTAKVYDAVKSDLEYIRDKTIRYIKAKNMILEYLQNHGQITNPMIQELCNFSKQQARTVTDRMRSENLLELCGKGKNSYYIKK